MSSVSGNNVAAVGAGVDWLPIQRSGKAMDEEELKEFFSEFGTVHQLNILRDKSTGVSR